MSRYVATAHLEDVQASTYDLALFASGYERRSSFVAQQLDISKLHRTLVLGFPSHRDAESRLLNDTFFKHGLGSEVVEDVEPEDDQTIINTLSGLRPSAGQPLRLLVDYSSMSRVWYAGVLSWLRTSPIRHQVVVDFAYSLSEPADPYPVLPVESISTLAGFEGTSLKANVMLVLGLGFDSLAPLSVVEQMEPTRSFLWMSSQARGEWAVNQALTRNADLVEEVRRSGGIVVSLPLADIPYCYAMMADMIAPLLRRNRVVLVPMGPKPQALVSLLLGLRFPEVSCLRVHLRRADPELCVPTGEVVVTQVRWPDELDSPLFLSAS
jgi:hypothetical protein